ncbi:tRNA 2-thiouridine synthesizing protein D [Pseudomonas duriflava]|uniref:tRNA 2-thiouridine synthesizing protein D n=1 Tax=Pseudomonas duriflava TaxID=459528 RepID=A0A562Q1B8_9PSED|nr:sulfurtransferase complex subunit TusD [Pseudomonas duriflava]TWI50457.1 tRNA 2-thiouridine synthesizing protein D [Pseudomonas duriflava]
MKFTIALFSPAHSPASRRALRFAEAVLANAHSIERIFFYREGVYNASHATVFPQDELDIAEAWTTFVKQHDLDAVVCISAALRRGLLDCNESQRYSRETITVKAPWQLSGLGQLHEAVQQSDRLVCFGDS